MPDAASLLPLSDYLDALLSRLPAAFLQDPIPPDSEGRYSRRTCEANGCPRMSHRRDVDVCRPHWQEWEKTGSRTDIKTWLTSAGPRSVHFDGRASLGWFDVSLAGSTLVRHELAYGLARRGTRGRTTRPSALNTLARSLSHAGVRSLLDLRYDQRLLNSVTVKCGGSEALARSFLLDTLDELCDLAGVEPTRSYLGIASAGGGAWVNLNNVENAEFRTTIERWMRYRLNAESASPQHTQACVGFLIIFTGWLEQQGVTQWRDLKRQHLVAYVGYLHSFERVPGKRYSPKYIGKMISAIATFLDETSINGWADIPASARWLSGERPAIPAPKPRLIGKQAVARLRDPENLQLVDDPDCRLAIRILAETGLRRKDVVAGCSVDCLLDLGGNKWSLRYINCKATTGSAWGHEATAPISSELALAISEHIDYKRALFPQNHSLFARDARDIPMTLTMLNRSLTTYVQRLGLQGPDGQPLRVTPHMFRHQNATDWLEAGVPLPVIQKLLDHRSMTTTEIYARMSEHKVREQWEAARAVNKDGALIPAPEGILADAAWVHAFLGGATQALPNGRCGMPCSQSCEHANACLFCPLFITTPEYLPVLREQRDEHEVMIRMAEEHGNLRIVERNRKPFVALSQLIANLEAIDSRGRTSTHV